MTLEKFDARLTSRLPARQIGCGGYAKVGQGRAGLTLEKFDVRRWAKGRYFGLTFEKVGRPPDRPPDRLQILSDGNYKVGQGRAGWTLEKFDAHLTARLTAYRSFLTGITKSGRAGQV